ncbi:hypothetical protein CAY62_20830 (plasmid) [Photobacterium damselae subsp. damselae]|nr:hypothetical protein CAY62_20830 [Photobacterium damselae subsp. damselae]
MLSYDKRKKSGGLSDKVFVDSVRFIIWQAKKNWGPLKRQRVNGMLSVKGRFNGRYFWWLATFSK